LFAGRHEFEFEGLKEFHAAYYTLAF
jgi:hypothetical protein